MQFQLEQNEGIHTISAYDAQGLTIGDARYTQSLVVSPRQITQQWPVRSLAELETAHCEEILRHDPEIVILGSGLAHVSADPRWMVWFAGHGIGLEVMNSHAASRTYNILAGEQRRIAAAIIL